MAKPSSVPAVPDSAPVVQGKAPEIKSAPASRAASTRQTLDTLSGIDLSADLQEYTPADESSRLHALNLLAASGEKINTLGIHDGNERQKTMDVTRRKYGTMDSARQVSNRLFAALNEHFSKGDAKELKDLARHASGHYLNTDQYHSAPHALGMTREMLQLAEIAGYTDPKVKKALVIAGIYHDAGNGIHPVPPVGPGADEVQAFKVLAEDLKNAESVARLSVQGIHADPLTELKALQGIRSEMVSINEGGKEVQYPMLDVIAACIAATVFRDRFAPSDVVAFDQYVINILEILHGKGIQEISAVSLINIKKLINSGPAWITKNADISGSTNSVAVLQANLQNRTEDLRRGMAKDAGPVGYHNGFIGFISATWHQGLDWAPVKQAKQGAPFYMPDGNSGAVETYGRQRLAEEKERFEQLVTSHKPMMMALYLLIQQGVDTKDNVLAWPLRKVRESLVGLCKANGGLRGALEEAQKSGAMTKENAADLGSFEVTADLYPLLFDQRHEQKSICDLTPGMVNRIFAPNAARTQTSSKLLRNSKLVGLAADSSWEEIEAAVGSLNDTQKALIDEKRQVGAQGKDQAQYWNDLRDAGLSIAQIQDLAACGKVSMPGYEDAERTKAAVEALEDLEGGVAIDLQPCLARLLEVADINPDVLRTERFEPGSAIIGVGENPERVLVIVKGRATVRLGEGESRTLVPGSVIGEISALTGKGAVAEVVAVRGVECISLPAWELANNYQNDDLRLSAARLAAGRLGISLE